MSDLGDKEFGYITSQMQEGMAFNEERSWFFYLAEISLRRTVDNTQWLLYQRGEEEWITNVAYILRQYAESDEQISLW